MSDAEATIKFALLDGYSAAIGQPDGAIIKIEAVFDSLFKPETRWAIKEYLEEIER